MCIERFEYFLKLLDVKYVKHYERHYLECVYNIFMDLYRLYKLGCNVCVLVCGCEGVHAMWQTLLSASVFDGQ